jgi:dihydrodipicolinate synthase/N-acetylneuraminate lyase
MEVIRAHERGDHQAMFDAYATVMHFFALNRYPGGSMRFLKSVMQSLGLTGVHLREPFFELTPEEHARVARDVEQFGVRALAGLPAAG